MHGLPGVFPIKDIQQQMHAAGKALMIVDTADWADQIEPLIHTSMKHRTEGIPYVAKHHQEVASPEVMSTCLIVLVNCFDALDAPSVLPDGEQRQYDLMRQIIRHGHARIAYTILLPGTEATRLRIQGCRHALEGAGISSDPELLQTGCPNHSNDSEPLLMAILRLAALPQSSSVICCSGDETTVRVYGVLRTRGLHVPERVSVVGYGNHSTIAEMLFPPLISTELPYMYMDTLAADTLLGATDSEEETGHVVRVVGETM